VSPNARDRARAKRRYEKRQATLAQRAQARRTRQQILGAVVAVAVVVVGAVALNHFVGSGTSKKGATPASNPTSTPSTTAAAGECPAGSNKPNANPPQFKTAPPASLAAGRTWTATVKTSCGTMTFSLEGKKAPQTVASFIYLARKGFFDKSPCQRLTTSGIFVLQCGDPTGTGNGGPGYQFGVENSPKATGSPAQGDYPAGTVAMARTATPKSNGSQFFLVYKDTKLPESGGTGYTIFGRVTKGLDVVTKIAAAGVSDGSTDGAPTTPIDLTSVTVK
jgi:peptidyl-prolyl cis-trans isomerase B (cyclophilin B)